MRTIYKTMNALVMSFSLYEGEGCADVATPCNSAVQNAAFLPPLQAPAAVL